jgi:LacI family transcriptional regulator
MLSITPITQRDVAHACGVHPSTICLALKNSPSIPEETRRRIQLVAQELGYQPNAAARNLALLRTEKKSSGSLPIAWINQEDRRDHWRTDPQARVCFQAAQQRAGELGYHLEDIWIREPGMSTTRVVQIARARGIEGIVFPVHRSFDFSLISPAWKDFSLVGLNDHRLAEWVDVVCPDHHRNAEMVLRQIDRLGCTRVGLVLGARFDAASRGLVQGCFQRHQSDLAPVDRIPV